MAAEKVDHEILSRWDKALASKRPFLRNWQYNQSFYMGYQWLNTNGRVIRPVVEKDNRKRLVNNIILPYVRTGTAKILTYSPAWEVVPGSNSENDISNAKTCERLLEYLWWKLDCREILREIVHWGFICGNGYLHVYWDRNSLAGPKFPEIKPIFDMNGTEIGNEPTGKVLSGGEIGITALSPFEVTPEPGIKRFKDANYVFVASRMSVETVYDRWGVEVQATPEEPEEKIIETALSFDAVIPAKSENTVLVKAYWEKSTRRHPEGRLVLYTDNGYLLYEGPNPDPQQQIPIYQVTNIDVPGRIYGTSVVEQSISIQKTYNKVLSQVVENTEATNNAKWMNPKGSGVKDGDFNNLFNTVVTYNPGHMPTRETPTPLPPHLFQVLELQIKQFENISGQHEVSKAGIPSGVRSGLAISYLQEQDESQLKPFFLSIESALRRVGIKILELAKEHYREDRILNILGHEKEYQMVVFKRDVITDEIDVRVRITSSLPQSPTARRDFVLLLKQNGLLADPNQILRLMELGTREGLFDENEQDRAYAEYENEMMAQGNIMVPRDFDNHIIHGQVLNKYRKTMEFARMPEALQAIFNEHARQHIQMLAGITMGGGEGGASMAPQGPTMPTRLPGGINAPLTPAAETPMMPEISGGA